VVQDGVETLRPIFEMHDDTRDVSNRGLFWVAELIEVEQWQLHSSSSKLTGASGHLDTVPKVSAALSHWGTTKRGGG